MARLSNLSESLEDYLEIILQLGQEKGEARVKEIAARKGVRMASVTGALKRLGREGLIEHRAREMVELTRTGHELANRVLQRHEFISRFLQEVLGVNPDTASRDACAIEHVISLESLDRLAGFMEFLKACPHSGDDLVERFQSCYAHGVDTLAGNGDNPLACRQESCQEGFSAGNAKLFSRSVPVLALSDLEPGERARVVSVRAATPIRQRLIDMGLLPGVELIMQRVAPFGDPIDIKLKGFHLSLRMIEAESIAVERY